MHSTLPSSLARFRQPSRATSKNGLFIAFGTMAKRYLVSACAGASMIASDATAYSSFFMDFPPHVYPDDCLCRGRIDNNCHPGQYTSQQSRADAIDQHGGDDDHADQGLLPVGIDLRQHQAVSDNLEQHAADDGAERPADAAGEIGAPDHGGRDHVQLVG